MTMMLRYIDLQIFLPQLTKAKFRGNKSTVHNHNKVKFQSGMAIRRILGSETDSYKKKFFLVGFRIQIAIPNSNTIK